MPIPRTAAVRLSPCQLLSTKIPASLLLPTSTSLGHLIAAGSPYKSCRSFPHSQRPQRRQPANIYEMNGSSKRPSTICRPRS